MQNSTFGAELDWLELRLVWWSHWGTISLGWNCTYYACLTKKDVQRCYFETPNGESL